MSFHNVRSTFRHPGQLDTLPNPFAILFIIVGVQLSCLRVGGGQWIRVVKQTPNGDQNLEYIVCLGPLLL